MYALVYVKSSTNVVGINEMSGCLIIWDHRKPGKPGLKKYMYMYNSTHQLFSFCFTEMFKILFLVIEWLSNEPYM